MILTLHCPLELPLGGIFFDKGMGLMIGFESVLSPFIMGMVPNWRSVLEY